MAEQIQDAFRRPVWASEDALALLTFLTSRPGRRFLNRLRNDRPGHPSGPSRHSLSARAMASATIDGYELAIENIFLYLTEAVPEEAKAKSYPNLDNDEEWPEELKEVARVIPDEVLEQLKNPPGFDPLTQPTVPAETDPAITRTPIS